MAARCSWYDLTLTNKCTATNKWLLCLSSHPPWQQAKGTPCCAPLKESLRKAVYDHLMHFDAALYIFAQIVIKLVRGETCSLNVSLPHFSLLQHSQASLFFLPPFISSSLCICVLAHIFNPFLFPCPLPLSLCVSLFPSICRHS